MSSLNPMRLTSISVLILSFLTTSIHALQFSVNSLNCSLIDWSLSLNELEWSVSSYIQLSFVSTTGGQNYSTLYSALPTGPFPSAGDYDYKTPFGNTKFAGTYRIGVNLVDGTSSLVQSSSSAGIVQTSAFDSRTFTFSSCATTSTSGTLASVTAASSSSTQMPSAPSSFTKVFTSAASSVQSTSSSSIASPSTSANSASASAPAASATSHKSNAGAIAGGVVGGVAALLLLLALARWCRSRKQTEQLSSDFRRRALLLSEKNSGPSSSQHHPTADPSTHDLPIFKQYTQGGARSVRSGLGGASISSMPSSPNEGPNLHDPEQPEIQVVHQPFNLVPNYATPGPGGTMQARRASMSSPVLDDPVRPGSGSGSPTQQQFPRPRSYQHQDDSGPPTTPGASTTKGLTSQRSIGNFKIPRVTVPVYNGEEAIGATAMSREDSNMSSLGRRSIGGDTFVSVDEDPFEDAVQTDGAGHVRRQQ